MGVRWPSVHGVTALLDRVLTVALGYSMICPDECLF